MTIKYHPKHRTYIDRRGEFQKEIIPMRECEACKQKCAACGWPFTLSTASPGLDMFFCSSTCEKRGIPFDNSGPAKKGHRS